MARNRCNRCNRCGAYLDAGERCDCVEVKEAESDRILGLLDQERNGQITLKEGSFETEKA